MLCLMAASGWLSMECAGQPAAARRIYRASEGLRETSVSSVTVSPRGNVWAKQNEVEVVSVLNGYSIHALPAPGQNSFRVYESRSGQLWMLYSGGLLVYDGRQWIEHPISEVRMEIQRDPLRQIRQIPLVPADRDRVFLLLGEQLLEYEAASRQVRLIRHVSQTGLQKFSEMAEARDGGLWVTGQKGLAKFPGPLRQLGPESACVEFQPGPEHPVENLQRPFENSRGGITTVAFGREERGRRYLLQFEQGIWRSIAVRDHAVRQAWEDWDGNIWTHTVNVLFRVEGGQVVKQESWAGQIRDVALESGGVFWLATAEGLVRHSPPGWRLPVGVPANVTLVHGMVEESQTLWALSSEGLLRNSGDRWELARWPADFDIEFRSTDSIYSLSGGRVAVSTDEPILFEPGAGFQRIVHPEQRTVRLVGQMEPGVALTRTESGGGQRIEQYDGTGFSLFIEVAADWLVGDVIKAYAAASGEIWLSGTGGLGVWRNGSFELFGASDGFELNRVQWFVERGDGKIWCADSEKIAEYNGRTWSAVRHDFERINGMARQPSGPVFVATSAGVYLQRDESWVLHTVEEGLGSLGVYEVFVDSQGRTWAGTAQGICRYYPDADGDSPRVFTPILREPEPVSSEVPVTVVFRGTDKWKNTRDDRLLFSYRLNAGAWSPYTNVSIRSFPGLGSGRHRLETRAMDRFWNRSPESAVLEFAVVQPWYRDGRILAILTFAAGVVLFLAGVAVNRHRQLVRSYARVEEMVGVRSGELERAQQQLVQSQKMTALGTLAAGIAHDFNNILSIIKGSAQIIEKNIEDREKIQIRLARINMMVDQGSGIVRSMLGLSREMPEDRGLHDPNEMVEETLKALSDRLPAEVQVRFEAEPVLPSLLCTRELFQQILVNLILNASEAMSGHGQVTVRTGHLTRLPSDLALSPARAQTYVFVAVEDTGQGIEPAVLSRVFEPFFTTKAFSVRRGTGLGLSMVYEVARQMGFGVGVRSTLGQGSIFTVYAPVAG